MAVSYEYKQLNVSINMAYRAKKMHRLTADISPETRADLNRLVKLSRACNTKAAVISSIAMRYLDLLERQLEAADAGERLKVFREKQDGALEPLCELDLRL